MTVPDLAVVNTAPASDVVSMLAPLFEGAPRFLDRLAAARPFGTWDALFDAARSIAHAMPEAEQVALVDAHPRIGAPSGTLSALSAAEQGDGQRSAVVEQDGARPAVVPGPDEARARVAAELDRLNATYEAAFGFRYCVFVAGRPREALLPAMAAALGADRAAELNRALEAVVDIAAARLATLCNGG
ncbi:MAG: 2-oxo-4-hydroxy-4-carboxy-5-ureidoimidazoline decarboxylase [Candidatus Limnocylindrales bacterium]